MRFAIKLSLLAPVLAATFGLVAVVHADTVDTFYLSNFTFASGATAQGSVTIDVTTGQFLTGDITYSGSSTYVFSGVFQDQSSFDSGSQYYGDIYTLPSFGGEDFDIDIPLNSLVSYGGGPVCSLADECGSGSY